MTVTSQELIEMVPCISSNLLTIDLVLLRNNFGKEYFVLACVGIDIKWRLFKRVGPIEFFIVLGRIMDGI